MRKKIWVHKSDSFNKAEEFDHAYYFSMTPEERLDVVQFLRERSAKLKEGPKHENRKRLRRILRITERA